jgi:hypothetical protein
MKQGSGDDPFAEEEPDDGDELEADPGVEASPDTDTASTDPLGESEPNEAPAPETGRRSLPYIHSRDGVKDGRTQRPVFLRDHVEAGIGELVDRVEADLGEDVYKTDVTEAAMVVAQNNPELVRAQLEEWGYGWD